MKNFILNKKILDNLFLKEFFLKACLVLSSFHVITWFIKKYTLGNREPFWDLVINYCAGQSYMNGISPYKFAMGINPLGKCLNESGGLNDGFSYVATVPLLKLSGLLAQLDIELVKNLWMLIILFSFFTIFFTSIHIYKIKKKYLWFMLMTLFSFGGVGFFSFLTGNISILCGTLISIGIYFYIQKKNIDVFCLFVCFAALLRPQFFLFILLPFMEENKKYIIKVFFYSFIVFLFFFYDFVFQKEMFIGFLKGVAYVRSDGFFWTFGDGIGLDAIIDQLPYAILLLFDIYIQAGPSKYSNFLWIIIASIILLGSYLLLNRKNSSKKINQSTSIALGVIIITACLPRLQMYDLILALPATYCIGMYLMEKNQKMVSLFGFIILSIMYAVHDINAPLFLFFMILFYFMTEQYKYFFVRAEKK